jgi:hypothetical protein
VFTKEMIRQALWGCFEIMLFMRSGVNRFSDTREDALRSFMWPVLFLPFAMVSVFLHPSDILSMPWLLLLHLGRMLVTLTLFLVIVYALTIHYGRQGFFFKFVNIFNWMNIPAFVLALPGFVLLGVFSFGAGPFDSLGELIEYYRPFEILTILLGYVYLAFILTHALRIPWEIAGFIAIVNMCITETLLDMVLYISGITAA